MVAGDETHQAPSRDISLGGMFLDGLCPVRIGTEVTLSFELPRLGEVKIPGFVRWTTPTGFGVQFGLIGARETHAVGALIRVA